MQKLIALIGLISCSYIGLSQPIPSSCAVTPEIETFYQDAPDRLALRHILATNSAHQNEPAIHQTTIDTFMNALAAVYNVTNLPARDSVIDIYEVSINEDFTMQGFDITADSGSAWMENLQDFFMPSGLHLLDSLDVDFGFSVTDYDDFSWLSTPIPQHRVMFQSATNLNITALCSILVNDNQIESSDPAPINISLYSRDDIEGEIFPNYVKLSFTKCFHLNTGCIDQRTWVFHVYNDCSVEFVGSFGDPAWPVGLNDPEQGIAINVYPNPSQNVINFDLPPGVFKASLYNSVGGLVHQETTSSGQSLDLGSLPKGSYFLQLDSDNYHYTSRIIKL